jgi:TnpA family transposase
MLRLGGALLQGRVPATGIMRTLQVGDNPTRLAQGIAEFGHIDKTLHSLRFIDDKDMRRGTLTQLNRGEGWQVLRASFSAVNGANCGSVIAKGRKINSARSVSSSI